MKRTVSILFLILLIQNNSGILLFSQIPDPGLILNEMINAIRSIKTIQFTIIQTERIDGILKNQADAVKMQMNPLKMHISAENPEKSYEVLWVKGANNGNAWVHPGQFPYFTLNLNPEGNNLKLGHHSIFAINLNYLADLISHEIKVDQKSLAQYLKYQGLYDVDGRICYKILLEFQSFKLIPYTVKVGEDLVSIASQNYVSEYVILEKNKEIHRATDLKPGDKILIPERYAKSMVLFIDKNLKLPIIEMMYDDKGLFERYEFRKIQLNPTFQDKVFSKDNPEYHF